MQPIPTTPQPLSITVQPSNQKTRVGQTATFQVTAIGTPPLSYQWSKNGVAIKGATNASYTTPAAEPMDDGESFSVAVSNPSKSIESAMASLSVAARAPKTGDLRFQQVDAPSTSAGLAGGGLASNVGGGLAQGMLGSIGSPLTMGDNCGPAVGNPYACAWRFITFPLPNGVSGLNISYQSTNDYANLDSDLSALATPNTVITSLDLEPADNTYAISSVQSTQTSGFDFGSQTVPPDQLQATASQLGTESRVITAVSFDASGQVFLISYGWQNDATTIYESKIATATLTTIGTEATNLASAGYIITALGGNSANGYLLVGTRVQGDTISRPLLVVTPANGSNLTPLMNSGDALIGYLFDATAGAWTWIGEQ